MNPATFQRLIRNKQRKRGCSKLFEQPHYFILIQNFNISKNPFQQGAYNNYNAIEHS